MFSKFKDTLVEKDIDENKKNIEFEKGDFLALFIAAASFMFPILLLFFLFIALIVWIVF